MDDALFEKIYDGTARSLWAYISRISGNPTVADDILQEAYLRFLASPPRTYSLAEVKPYLYKIATNLVYDRFRRMRRETGYLARSTGAGELEGNISADESGMMQVFSRLTHQERSLLWLAYVEGYEHREIADILKLSRLSIRVMLYRARQKLAKLLEAETEVLYEEIR